jgi:hypothetical protein
MRPLTPKANLRLAIQASLPCLLLTIGACTGDDGSDGQAAPEPPTPDALTPRDDSPGVQVQILDVSGGSGAGGNFQPGDRLTVHFTIQKDDGSDWRAEEIDTARILVSGPTFNYQRVLAERSDLLSAARVNGDGSFTYTFPTPIPATYLPPLNDTASFGALDGELTGEALLAGTYTVGIYTGWNYTVDGQGFREQGDAVFDFLLGNSTTLQPRSLVSQQNCNQCHTDLQAHGGLRRNVTLCLLCHTAGAEDRNTASVAGGTPGVTIAFEVMIHKIHAGEHLPSVQGVGTLPDGTRDYTVPPESYLVMGFRDSLHDYSEVAFPAWPNLNIAMPRDTGYAALGSAERAQEDAIRTGVTSCYVCHGDPDGAGPLTEPAQGPVAYSQPSRGACGSCHDDVDWTLPYESNLMQMPAQDDDSACVLCHAPSGDALAVRDAHLHPLRDPTFATGLNVELLSIDEAGMNDADGTLDPGEKLALTFQLLDDLGNEVAPTGLSMNVAVSGPTENMNLLHYVSFPSAALSGPQPFTTMLPERVWFEPVGLAGAGMDVLTTTGFPHWNVSGALTEVRAGAVDVGGGNSTLTTAIEGPINWIDVLNATGFARDDFVVIDRGLAGEEVLLVRQVVGNRLWFASPYTTGDNPGPRRAHTLGAAVEELALTTLTDGLEYTLDAATGTVTEAGGFTDGDTVVVTYTTDFVMPQRYPVALNGSPDLDARHGSWSGLELVDGTYTLGLWASRTLPLPLHGESNSYRETSPGVRMDFLVGSASSLAPYDLISSPENCNSCHQDMWFHGGGRRGFDTCILCHGTAGAEDRPTYVAAGAPDTTGLTVNFRTMLHKIHRGADLANAATYEVVGFGNSPYPNNFGLTDFAEVHFPSMPDGVKDCAKCHGSSDVWREPAARERADLPAVSSLAWTVTCGACHDASSAQAHIEIMTSPSGTESCATCHSEEDDLAVPLVHRIR